MSILVILLIVFLLFGGIGVAPHWGYSQSWGYGPSGGFGIILIIVVLFLVFR
jgi:hypothetical protein